MKTVRVGGVEYVLFGDYVAVVRNLKAVQREVNFGGDSHVVWGQVPYGRPYIDFPAIRQIGSGGCWIDEDSSISSGLTADEAHQVAAELLLAAEWLEQNKDG